MKKVTSQKLPTALPAGLTYAETLSLPNKSSANITAVAWSMDGLNLAIAASSKQGSHLFIRDIAKRRWISVPVVGRIWGLNWSGTTNQIAVAYTGHGTGERGGVLVCKFDGGGLTKQWSWEKADAYSVFWSPDQKYVAAGLGTTPQRHHTKSYRRGGITILAAASGKVVARLDTDIETASLVWLDGETIIAGYSSPNKETRNSMRFAIWNLKRYQKPSIILPVETEFAIALLANQNRDRLWSSHNDKTVRTWERSTGRMMGLHEGLTSRSCTLAIDPEGQILAGQLESGEAFLLHADTLTKIAEFPGNNSLCISAVSFHPYLKMFAVIASGGKKITLIGYDLNALRLENVIQRTTRYANAKVILLGDTGVGKSGLSNQLVNGRYEKTDSSHARRAHLLSSQVVDTPEGGKVQREILLWDLAGQPAYRLVHQLSVEDASVACVLCDARREANPLEGATYWAQVLGQARTIGPVTKFLVASRVDVGGLPASPERMTKFAEEQGFDRFFKTSALSGEGCVELRKAIIEAVPWDRLPPVSSTKTLTAVRQFVSGIKHRHGQEIGNPPVTPELRKVGELHQEFAKTHGESIEFEEFVGCLERLEQTDVIDLLTFRTAAEVPTAQTAVLLDPTRVDAYASAILVAAKDEPDGPGHLEEVRVLDGKFKLETRERMTNASAERLVLWYVLESLFRRDLALPEKIKGRNYLVFPAQCTTALRYPDKDSFGVALEFSGPVRSIYATLIAQFAHYEGFSRREFFQDAARYRPDKGGHCVVRLDDHGNGTAELLVSFDAKAPPDVRRGFLEFIGQHLRDRSVPGSVKERHACHCIHCGEGIDDRAVRARIGASKKTLVCSFCGGTMPLVNLLAPVTAASSQVAMQMRVDATEGRQRITAAWVVKSKEQQRKYDVFLSHNSRDKKEVEALATRLKAVGIRPWLDKWDLVPGNTISDALEVAIKTIPCAVLFFGKADLGDWHIMEIRAYIEQWAKGTARMIPAVLPGVNVTPEMPLWVRQNLWVDLRKWKSKKSDALYRLVCGIVNRKPGASPRTTFTAGDVVEWTESVS